MKIIVTGGAGFIGSHLVEELLKKKYRITVIDNLSTGRLENIEKFLKKIKFVKADISVNGTWKKELKNAKMIFHLAALADIVPSIKYPDKYFDANVTGTKNIINNANKYNVKKIIYSASSSCYGIPKKYPTNEKEITDPKYPYALTKLIGESILFHFGNLYKIKIISLRLFNVYGTKSRTSGTYGAMFGTFLKQKICNKPLTVVGSGNQKRDFIYVTDVIKVMIKCMNYSGKKNIFNIGYGKTISVNKIAELLKSKKIFISRRPGEPFITHANINLAKKHLSWKPKIDISKGVSILLKDLDYWKNAPLWDKKKIKIATKLWFKYLS